MYIVTYNTCTYRIRYTIWCLVVSKMWIIRLLVVLFLNGLYAQYGTYKYNVLNRPTNQSSTYRGGNSIVGTSGKAVDDDTGNDFQQGSCTHTERDNPAWWVVDMGENVTVHSVTITNRLGDYTLQRLDKFSIFGVNSLYYSEVDKQECFHFDAKFGNGLTRTFNCFHPIATRFLAIVIMVPGQILTLCDVQVSAECQDGEFGVNCAGTCSSHCKISPCDKFSQYGTCLDGECMDGYQGLNCTEDCPSGTFGHDCKEQCHCKEGTCDHVTGLKCPFGCADGYRGETCSESTTTSLTSPTVAFAVPLAIMCVLCTGLIIYIIILKVKQRRAKENDILGSDPRLQEAAYVNVDAHVNGKQSNTAQIVGNAEQRTYEQLSHPVTMDQIAVGQAYQELQM